MKTIPSLKILAVAITTAFTMTACFWDDDKTIHTGQFIDAEVKGLTYESSACKTNCVTNEKGEFEYHAGNTVKFYAGETFIGQAQGDSIVRPHHLTDESAVTGKKAVRIARLLLALDSDPTDSILDITEKAKSLKPDCKTDSDANLEQCAIDAALTLPNEEDAYAHLIGGKLSAKHIGQYLYAPEKTGGDAEGATEIVTYSKALKKAYVTNGKDNRIDIIDLQNPSAPTKAGSIDMSTQGDGINSVALYEDQLAIAVEVKGSNGQDKGKVVLVNVKDTSTTTALTVGYLPDMVTFTPDGKKILVANEGEPSDDYTHDPEGSVSIIDVASSVVTEVSFAEFNAGGSRHADLPSLVRITGPSVTHNKGVYTQTGKASVAQDLEPEYIAIANDSKTAWVVLQENNALAEIDIASAKVTKIHALGTKDYGLAKHAIDASDKDDTITFSARPSVVGTYMPDAIATYKVNGVNYILTANEGDGREYGIDMDTKAACEKAGGIDYDDGKCIIHIDEKRLGKFNSDELSATLATPADSKSELGRLKVTTTEGKDSQGILQTAHSFGARSFSIWKEDGTLVYDSGNDFAVKTNEAGTYPDNRSDDKGTEPEGIELATIGSQTYVFIGLERSSGFMIYDVTQPEAPRFIEYIKPAAHDISPEGLKFIPATDSPNGKNLLLISNEYSSSLSIYELTQQ